MAAGCVGPLLLPLPLLLTVLGLAQETHTRCLVRGWHMYGTCSHSMVMMI
jgi:hypothetical protein